jgi:hypothetical protein
MGKVPSYAVMLGAAVFTNRDWASLFWLGLFVAWVLSKKDVRSSLADVARTAMTPKILLPTLTMFGYIAATVLVGAKLKLWNSDLFKDTVVWSFGPALVLLFSISDAGEKEHFFRRAVLNTIKYTILIEFYMNLVVLSLPVELVLVPVVTILTLLSIVTSTDDQYKSVKTLLNWVTSLIGCALLITVTTRLAHSWHRIDAAGDLRQFALPVWLTVGLLPYIYLLSLWAGYELLFLRIDFATDSRMSRRRAKLALLVGLNARTHRVNQFAHPWMHRVSAASSFSEAYRVVRNYRHSSNDPTRDGE